MITQTKDPTRWLVPDPQAVCDWLNSDTLQDCYCPACQNKLVYETHGIPGRDYFNLTCLELECSEYGGSWDCPPVRVLRAVVAIEKEGAL